MNHTSLKQFLLHTTRSTAITFERYMALCLYHPEFGYYTAGRERTGVAGDYFTSADLHPVFARLIARQAAEMWETLGRPQRFAWIEMGAGRGLFAADFLAWTASALPEFAAALDYVAIEPGAVQRQRIEARVAAVGMAGKIRVLANLEELPMVTGCFFSNELVDAFPVHVVMRSESHLKEVYVAAQEDALVEKLGKISDPAVGAQVARYAPQLEEGNRIEVNLNAQAWIRAVAAKLARGYVLTIDYGDLAPQLFTADRPRGTLLAYHGHTFSENFYAAPGEMDLTSHVNFTAVVDAGNAAGLEFAGFTTQERFLLALGEANQFADLFDPGQSEVEKLDARLKLKRLIAPEGMGGVFKVMLQQRGGEGKSLTGWRFGSRGV